MRPPDETVEAQWLLAPCVYAWKRGDKYLYVGLGVKGLARPFGRHHVLNRVERFALEDVIELWRFENSDDAVDFEKRLIREFRPKYNRRDKFRAYCERCDNSWLTSTPKPLKCNFCQAVMTTNGVSHYELRMAENRRMESGTT